MSAQNDAKVLGDGGFPIKYLVMWVEVLVYLLRVRIGWLMSRVCTASENLADNIKKLKGLDLEVLVSVRLDNVPED